MTRRSVDQRPTRLIRTLAIGVATIALLGACTSDGSPFEGEPGDVELPAPETPEPEAPEPEPEAPEPEPEAPEPEPEAPAPEAPPSENPDAGVPTDDDGLTTEEWVLLIVIGLAALALVMGVVSLATNHSDKQNAARSSQNRRVGELVGLGRWILDQGSVDVLRATEAQQLQTAWQTMRARSIDLETRSASLAGATVDQDVSDMVQRLAADVAGLRGSLETNVSLRLDPNAAAKHSVDRGHDEKRVPTASRRTNGPESSFGGAGMTGDMMDSEYGQPQSNKTSGWVIFAGVFAGLASFGNVLYGLTLLFNDEWVALSPNALISFDFTTVGATFLIFGILQLFIALGLFNGDLWARVLGIVWAALNVFAQMSFMSVYPQWSWLLIIVNGLIIYGLTVHGDEVAKL